MRPAILTVMSQALCDSAKGLLRDFGELQNIQKTSAFLSSSRNRTERMLRSYLEQRDAAIPVVTEIPAVDEAPCWIVDALDGQENFARGLKSFCSRLVLWERGRVMAYAVYDVLSHEVFSVYEGRGAYINQNRLRVSPQKNLSGSIVSIDGVKFSPQIMPHVHVRQTGCISLDVAYVAAGRFEGCCLYGQQKPWAALANALFIKEANGFSSYERGTFLAGNESMHSWLKKCTLPEPPKSL